jgi:hypothetical protein
MYQILIVGAGIAGLRTAIKLKEKKPELAVTILEKYANAGGRMETIHVNETLHYESGAGRFHSSHKELVKLLKKYNLTQIKLPETSYWKTPKTPLEPNNFFAIWIELCDLFKTLPEETLQTTTLRFLAIEFLGVELAKKILDTYPYRAEIEIMSAQSALDLFDSFRIGHFSVVKEGFTELITHIRKDAEKLGIKFKFNQDINRVDYIKTTNSYKVSGLSNNKLITYEASRVILAVPKNALENIYPFSPETPLLKKVRMEPLMRIYSIYKNSSWFPDKNVITDGPLRYIIPVNKASGLIMSSYLDSRDIEPWADLHKKKNQEKLAEKIHNETQTLFHDVLIEKATYTKAHHWADGCSYWLPGDYDYKKASKEAFNPMPHSFPHLHLVGESFSKKQQWIEGSLEHADDLVNSLHLD